MWTWRLLSILTFLIGSVRSFNHLEFKRKHCYLDTNVTVTYNYFPYYERNRAVTRYVCENFTLTKSDLDSMANDDFYITDETAIIMKNCDIEYFNHVWASKFAPWSMDFDNCRISLEDADINQKDDRPPLEARILGFHNCEILDNLNSSSLQEFRDLSMFLVHNSTLQYSELDEYLLPKQHKLSELWIHNTIIKSIDQGLFTKEKGFYIFRNTCTSCEFHEIDCLLYIPTEIAIISLILFENNSIAKLPSNDTFSKKLDIVGTLNLSGNKITELSLTRVHMKSLNRIKSLDLSRNANITAISYLAFNDTELENLNMSSVNLELLEKLGNYHLKTIDFSHNKISNIKFDVFEDLINLERLDLSHNQISMLEGVVFKGLGNLKDLRLNSNELHEIPNDFFKYLTNLEFLNLSSNGIKKVYGFQHPSPIQEFILRHHSLTIKPANPLLLIH